MEGSRAVVVVVVADDGCGETMREKQEDVGDAVEDFRDERHFLGGGMDEGRVYGFWFRKVVVMAGDASACWLRLCHATSAVVWYEELGGDRVNGRCVREGYS